MASSRSAPKAERIAACLKRNGFEAPESLLLAIAVVTTTSSPLRDEDADWITSTASRIRDKDLVLEAAGVVFGFNTINRIADARRVPLEFRFLRELKPIRGWIERRLASLTGLAFDLSFKHQLRRSPAALMDRVRVVFEHLGVATVPNVISRLSRSPVVLEGVLEMIESNVMNATVHSDLLREAVAIGVASRTTPGSDLRRMVDQWLPPEALRDSKSLRAWANSSRTSDADLVSACRKYAWQVANAAYTITDEQISTLHALGLSDAELLDLTLATAVFSALAIIEPISAAAVPTVAAAEATLPLTQAGQVQVQFA